MIRQTTKEKKTTLTLPANHLVLVDGSSYLFRAYYALPPLMTSQGQPTGAIYGVINMLKKLLTDYAPSHIAVVFDPKGKSFRHNLYPLYKANRTVMPHDLQSQIEGLFDIIRGLGIPLVIENGYEADDVIATLTTQAVKQKRFVLISTGDKDLAQLVNEQVALINTMSGRLLDVEGVKEKFGVLPTQMVDYLTLTGDSTDNLPGVPQVGPKTAAKWLEKYESLDRLVAHAQELTGKVGENFRNTIPQFPLMRELVTVKSTVPLHVTVDALERGVHQVEQLKTLFTQLEFKSWLVELSGLSQQETPGTTEVSNIPIVITTPAAFKKCLVNCQRAQLVSISLVVNTRDAGNSNIMGIGLSSPQEMSYIPLAHSGLDTPVLLQKEKVMDALRTLLTDFALTVISENAKLDRRLLEVVTNGEKATWYDVSIESYVLNSNETHTLSALAAKYLGKELQEATPKSTQGVKRGGLAPVSIQQAANWAGEKALVARQLHEVLFSLIKTTGGNRSVFEKIDMPLVTVLSRMEQRGVLVDVSQLLRLSKTLTRELKVLRETVHRLAQHEFNLDSPKQLQAVLYDRLKLPILRKTPGGQPSTDESVLQELALSYELPKFIVEYRRLNKLKTTYTDRLPEQVNPTTGRVHTSFNQTVTSTGRLSSNNPNLQNIPIRTPEGRKIRQAFVAAPGYVLVSADYSQVELRIMAHIAQEHRLLETFSKNQDVHTATAAEVFHVSLNDVTGEQRRRAKAINFGLLYGMSKFGLSKQLGIDTQLAEQYINIYFDRYPKIREYINHIREIAAAQGYVETLFGRRIFLPGIHSGQVMRRRAAQRAAINAPMQGTAADIIKLAMIKLDDWNRSKHKNIHMILQVHDELVFEVLAKNALEISVDIQKMMESVVLLTVPLKVEMGVGSNWDEAHSFG